jgi:hypothetical protein
VNNQLAANSHDSFGHIAGMGSVWRKAYEGVLYHVMSLGTEGNDLYSLFKI